MGRASLTAAWENRRDAQGITKRQPKHTGRQSAPQVNTFRYLPLLTLSRADHRCRFKLADNVKYHLLEHPAQAQGMPGEVRSMACPVSQPGTSAAVLPKDQRRSQYGDQTSCF